MLAEVNLAHAFILHDFVGTSSGEYAPGADDVGVIADTERFTHIVIGEQHTDSPLLEEADDLLNFQHGDRVDTGDLLVALETPEA